MVTKSDIRDTVLSKLTQRPKLYRFRDSHTVEQKIINYIKRSNAKSVLLYISMATEANTQNIIKWCRQRGISVFVPFMLGSSFIVVQYRLPLYKKRFNIYEPKISKKYRKKGIDIAIVPVISIDKSGRRVGFGKGMYDRFFAREGRHIGKTVFVAKDLYIYDGLITQEYDIESDYIVSTRYSIIKSDIKSIKRLKVPPRYQKGKWL